MAEFLHYPSEFNSRMPFIRFKAYKYLCPLPNIEILKKFNQREAANVPEIFLYMPGDFSENVVAEWSPENVLQGGGPDIEAIIIKNMSDVLSSTSEGGKLLASAQAAAGAQPFPTDINIFRAVQPMQFTLNFTMIPYNQYEANEILGIIKVFKTQILPTGNLGLGGGSLADFTKNAVLKFPNVWDLDFENINGLGLEKESRYESMCMTNCNVTYASGSEGASVYRDNNPVQVKLSLSFQSLRKQYLTN